ncbi:unnamed protein product [Parnassius mnemosyne]|uniref:Uncharacterized protein n=1 Tax=Parnassius mnemosyne TaxID=213953 RepID=A0AAV1M5M4_9NEOP
MDCCRVLHAEGTEDREHVSVGTHPDAGIIYGGTGLPTPVRDVSTPWACKGGGRLSQYRDAANLKEPRNATVRCFRVAKTWVHSLLGYLL